jgi:hypothetical protein
MDFPVHPRVDETIRHYVKVVQGWFRSQSGHTMRMVEANGEVVVEHLVLDQTQHEMDTADSFDYVRGQVFDRLDIADDEIALVFVSSATTLNACGEGSDIAIVWMDNTKCANAYASLNSEHPGHVPLTAAHELLHTIGAVDPCAPHEGNGHHVTDDPHDIMYEGGHGAYENFVLDSGRDDYYGHFNDDCIDVADSPIWVDDDEDDGEDR